MRANLDYGLTRERLGSFYRVCPGLAQVARRRGTSKQHRRVLHIAGSPRRSVGHATPASMRSSVSHAFWAWWPASTSDVEYRSRGEVQAHIDPTSARVEAYEACTFPRCTTQENCLQGSAKGTCDMLFSVVSRSGDTANSILPIVSVAICPHWPTLQDICNCAQYDMLMICRCYHREVLRMPCVGEVRVSRPMMCDFSLALSRVSETICSNENTHDSTFA